MAEKFDAIVVGAGPAGNAAAYTLAKRGLSVLQLERGEYPGAKNVQGAIMYADALEKVIPEFREDAPLERHIVEQRIWVMSEKSHVGTTYRSDDFNSDAPNRYTVIRANIDKWFSGKVKGAGALVICETTVTDLIVEDGKVKGVRTDRVGGDIHADVVVLCDGVNSLLAKKAGFHAELKPKDVALAVKEIHFMDRKVIDERFNISGDEGVVIEAMGTVTHGMVGTAFLYTNSDSLTVGIGCMVSDFKENNVEPYRLLEEFKAHPSIKNLMAGGEAKEYAGHLIPEGGYKAVPQLWGNGWVMCGDAAMFNNAVHREGSNLAMTSGRIAGETIAELHAAGKPMSADNLAVYRKRLDDSFLMRDLKKYQHMPDIMHANRQFFTTYPQLLNSAAHTMFTVDDVDKKTKQKQVTGAFKQARSVFGLLGDAFRMSRAFR